MNHGHQMEASEAMLQHLTSCTSPQIMTVDEQAHESNTNVGASRPATAAVGFAAMALADHPVFRHADLPATAVQTVCLEEHDMRDVLHFL